MTQGGGGVLKKVTNGDIGGGGGGKIWHFHGDVIFECPLTMLAIKRGLSSNFKKMKGRHFMGHSNTTFKFSITIDL